MASPLHRLGPRHHRAIAVRLAGEFPQAIAESLGVERRTVYVWFSDPLVKDGLDRRQRDLANLVTQRLADQTLASVSTPRSEAGDYRRRGGGVELADPNWRLEIVANLDAARAGPGPAAASTGSEA